MGLVAALPPPFPFVFTREYPPPPDVAPPLTFIAKLLKRITPNQNVLNNLNICNAMLVFTEDYLSKMKTTKHYKPYRSITKYSMFIQVISSARIVPRASSGLVFSLIRSEGERVSERV